MISVRRMTKSFGRITAVDDVSFEVPAGGSVALWGANGAGKTTLIRCLLGVIRFRGSATIDGDDVRRRGRRARSKVGYAPQELAFHDDARLGASLLFFAGLRRMGGEGASKALDSVGLAGHERTRVRDLSGGMKQRLALAVALLSDPPIIVLDEPTSSLDTDGRRDVVDSLRALAGAGKTIVFASHRPDEILALASRVLVMDHGKILRETTPAALWPDKAGVRLMRLHLRAAGVEAAARVLREAGHAVQLNGLGLCVAVAGDRKASPIHTLARARIEVQDMELLDEIAPPQEGAS